MVFTLHINILYLVKLALFTFLWSTRVFKKSSWWRLLCRYMFVEYESHRAAALARKKLVQGSVFLFGQEIGQVWTRVLKLLITWAQNIIFPIKIWYTKISTWFEVEMKLLNYLEAPIIVVFRLIGLNLNMRWMRKQCRQ